MSITLYMLDNQGRLGEMTVDDQGHPASATIPALPELLTSVEARGGTAKDLDGWFNGYVYVTADPQATFPVES